MEVNEETKVESKKFVQYLAATIACMGSFAMGNALGWYSPASIIFKANENINFTVEQYSWISASMVLGAAVGMPVMGIVVNFVGRKLSMILITPVFIVAWLCLLSENYLIIIAARFVTGLCGAVSCVAAPLFIGEIAEPAIRGRLGIFYQLLLCIGLLFTFIFGCFEDIYILTISCAIVPLSCLLLIFFYESPVYFLRRGEIEKARASLQFYRGKDFNIEPELKKFRDYIKGSDSTDSIWTIMKTKPSIKAAIICTGCHFLQQASGIKVVVFYVHGIFEMVGGNINVHVSSILVMSTLAFATLLSAYLIERAGRRLLLIISMVTMSACHVVLGAFFLIKDRDEELAIKISLIPLVFSCLYILCYSLGAGPVPWALQAELFPSRVKEVMSSFSACWNWTFAFLVTKFYPTFVKLVGAYGPFWMFATLCACGAVFSFFVVVETKGKTLEEIQIQLGGKTEKSSDLV